MDDVELAPEHSDNGLAVEWDDDDVAHRMQIQVFDFSNFDTFEDLLRQALKDGGSAEGLMRAWMASKRDEYRREGMEAVIALLWPHKKTFQALRALAFATGLTILGGKSGTELARECGCSKQNFKQASAAFRVKLHLRTTRTMRSQDASKKMKLTNFVHRKDAK